MKGEWEGLEEEGERWEEGGMRCWGEGEGKRKEERGGEGGGEGGMRREWMGGV